MVFRNFHRRNSKVGKVGKTVIEMEMANMVNMGETLNMVSQKNMIEIQSKQVRLTTFTILVNHQTFLFFIFRSIMKKFFRLKPIYKLSNILLNVSQ